MRAYLTLRESLHYRRDLFQTGLERVGYRVSYDPFRPEPDDICVIWNRGGPNNDLARAFEKAGARAVVAENGYLGNHFAGRHWFALALGHHNGAGTWPDGGPERWDALGVEPEPWRSGRAQTVCLVQRGIGEPGVAMPRGWRAPDARLRRHPGKAAIDTLRRDLGDATAVCTWGSGAALRALLWGYPAYYAFERWIGAPAAVYYSGKGPWPTPFRGDRLPMLRRLAWAMYTTDEIASGYAFDVLLGSGAGTRSQHCRS